MDDLEERLLREVIAEDLKNIYSKLNLSGRTEAILAMQQRGS